jgi:hypothetical protein
VSHISLNFSRLDGRFAVRGRSVYRSPMPPLKPLVLRQLTPEEREARERALKKAKAATKNGAKVGPFKKKKK